MHIRLLFLFLLSEIICVLPVAAQRLIDIQHYQFHLEIHDTTDRINGLAHIHTRFLNPDAASLVLNLVQVDPASSKGMNVEKVLVDGEPITFTHTENLLKITVPASAIQQDSTARFAITYSGIPADGLIISQNRFGERTFFGDNWPNRARNWLPCVDHPSDKATVEFIITSPDRYEVIANGYKVEESDLPDNKVLTHWKTDVALPTKVIVMGAARFAIRHMEPVGNIPVQNWIYPQDRLAGFHDYAPARDILEFLDSYIGPYPFEKLANVQSTTRYGGMENASNIFYAETSVTGSRKADDLIAHELAHQWFGNSATESDWPHFWLSEGFATYFEHIWIESLQGRDSIVRRLKAERDLIFRYEQVAPAPVIPESVPDPNRLLNPNSYEKGGWVLHMLRHRLGDEAFQQGIRQYYAKYSGKNAETRDLQVIMEAVSGQDLTIFFDQWLRRASHPRISGSAAYQGKRKQLNLRLSQTQDDLAYQLPLDIQLQFEDGTSQIHSIQFDQSEQEFIFKVDKKPTRIEFDPDCWLLIEAASISL